MQYNWSISGKAETRGTWKRGEKEIITEAGSTSRLNMCWNASWGIQGIKCAFALLGFSKVLETAFPDVFGSKMGLLKLPMQLVREQDWNKPQTGRLSWAGLLRGMGREKLSVWHHSVFSVICDYFHWYFSGFSVIKGTVCLFIKLQFSRLGGGQNQDTQCLEKPRTME